MSRLAPLLAALALLPIAALATLPPVTPGERVVFSDDFADNRNQWSSVAVVNKVGAGVTTQAAIGNSEWTASLEDSVAATSTAILKTPLNLKNGPVSVYLAARVDNPEGVEGNRFSVSLNEPEGRRGFVRFVTRPAANGFLEFRDAAGAGQSVASQSTRALFRADVAQIIKLTIRPAADAKSLASAEVFFYDMKSRTYQSVAAADGVVALGGELRSLSLFSRNGADGLVWIDSVVVTQGGPSR